MSPSTKSTIAGSLGLLVVFLISAAPVQAAGQQGMVVARDPQTGKLRAPTPEEMKALRDKAPDARRMAARAAASSVVTRNDGARGVRLGEKALRYSVVTQSADGQPTIREVQGEEAAEAAVQHGTSAVPAPVHHEEHDHDVR